MNRLVVGRDKTSLLEHLPHNFLLIDDSIGELDLPARRKVVRLDFEKDSFNPLKNISYQGARKFITILDSVFPEGENTLTKKTSNFVLLNALLANPKFLDQLLAPDKDPGHTDAYQKIQTLLLSPVLESFLNHPTNFSLDGIVLAQLDRTVMSEFDCFVIANILISAYKGTVIVPDFGFYGCSFHTSLIRQNRLWAGVNYLDETPLKRQLLLIDEKIAAHCTVEDAKVLASYAGFIPGFNDKDFVQTATQ